MTTETYYACCGKSLCVGCFTSFCKSGNDWKCPFCNSDQDNKTDEERVEEMMKRVEVNDAGAIMFLASAHCHGKLGLLRDRERAMEFWKQAAELGSSKAHLELGIIYDAEGNSKNAKFHYEAAAMAGNELARCQLAIMEGISGNLERALKHLTIAACAGEPQAMHGMIELFTQGAVSKELIDSTLAAYNNSCAEMRSEARDAYLRFKRSSISMKGFSRKTPIQH
jgi:TPR repeat protein